MLLSWVLRRVSSLNNFMLTAQAGEIIAGMLIGPPLADFVPYADTIRVFGAIRLWQFC